MTASLELCKELYELSGWGDVFPDDYLKGWWNSFEGKTTGSQWAEIYDQFGNKDPYDNRRPTGTTHRINRIAPAYDLGYLLRKLPVVRHSTGSEYLYRLTLELYDSFWVAGYPHNGDFTIFEAGTDKTPEDAACKLAIQLIKQGIIAPKQEAKS